MISNEQIVQALGCKKENVDLYWPKILTCMQSLGDASTNSQIGALATIGVETANTFKPLHEYGTDAQHEKLYGHRKDLGNIHDGDGARYAGRGFIQLTGEINYAAYGKLLGVDLVDNPDREFEPDVAASTFAAYWHEHKLAALCDSEDWLAVRKRVNGGTNGWWQFAHSVEKLKTFLSE